MLAAPTAFSTNSNSRRHRIHTDRRVAARVLASQTVSNREHKFVAKKLLHEAVFGAGSDARSRRPPQAKTGATCRVLPSLMTLEWGVWGEHRCQMTGRCEVFQSILIQSVQTFHNVYKCRIHKVAFFCLVHLYWGRQFLLQY